MIHTYRKQLIAALLVLLLSISGVITYSVLQSKKSHQVVDTPVDTAVIKGLDNKKNFPLSSVTQKMVETYLIGTLKDKHGSRTYTATVRGGSYDRVVTPQGGIIVSLLVDVAPFNETYLFYRTGDDNATMVSSQLRCADEADQMVQPSKCKDKTND